MFTKFDIDWFLNHYFSVEGTNCNLKDIDKQKVLNIINGFESFVGEVDLASPTNAIFACEFIKHYVMYNTISGIKVTPDTFYSNGVHKSSYRLYKDKDGNIINSVAYNFYVKHTYEDYAHREINIYPFHSKCNFAIYVYKGGIITGEYYILNNIKYSGELYYTPKMITIPASCILYDTDGKRNTIYIVDHREPALAKVLETYDMSYHIDENIKNRRFSLRKYEKIKSNYK